VNPWSSTYVAAHLDEPRRVRDDPFRIAVFAVGDEQ
jgi:hypothetical protein